MKSCSSRRASAPRPEHRKATRMAIPESFNSATGALTGDNLDHAIATGGDAARLTPNLRGDPDAGGQFQSAMHRPTPSLRGDPDAGGRIQSAMDRPTPSLRDDPDAGGQIQSAMDRPTPSLRDDPDAGGQIQSAVTGRRPASGTTPTPAAKSRAPCTGRRPASGTTPTPEAKSKVSSSCSAQPLGSCRRWRHFPPRARLTPRICSRSGRDITAPPFLTTPQHP